MRISDWSSDVCSSDLRHAAARGQRQRCAAAAEGHGDRVHAIGAGIERPAAAHRGAFDAARPRLGHFERRQNVDHVYAERDRPRRAVTIGYAEPDTRKSVAYFDPAVRILYRPCTRHTLAIAGKPVAR